MKRRSNDKDYITLSSSINHINNDNTNNIYQKRLRSWKRKLTPSKHNRTCCESPIVNEEVEPFYRSTIYTYPINLKYDQANTVSHTVLSESVTTESAFYSPSISYTSMKTNGDLNNNQVTTLNVQNQKRKNSTLSCESLSSQLSQIKTFDMLPDPNDEKLTNTKQSSLNNLQLTHYQGPTKRTRVSTDDDSIITNHRSLNSPILIDDDTIDINQLDEQEPLSSSTNNDRLTSNNLNSMETAVKMVQPIVNIIFDAFEDQLKNVQTKTIEASFPNSSPISSFRTISPHQIYSPMMMPSYPLRSSARPIILHAVNFNIQLTTKQSINNSTSTNIILNNNQNLQSVTLTELKQKLISYMLTNTFITNHITNDTYPKQRLKLKRIAQLAVVGVSVLCGYLLL
ncbi:unnamed protein product [Rotaria socialis]|uniref:Uncharacterized protein n=1 Tax=Rotaria socialis TaxID=392032 RepID=A0A821ABJ6_9BILA|nr:unnamed protein product [Rotaria socialis]CAF4578003.1 unnamed protein product [Rotaria socialis]